MTSPATESVDLWIIREAAAVVICAIVPGFVAERLKPVFEREQPPVDLSMFQVSSFAFPSSNAAATAGCAVAGKALRPDERST